jgi:hypothetical protein
VQRALETLLAELRQAHVGGVDQSLLDHLAYRSPDFAEQRRAPLPPRPSAAADPTPRASERGLR